MPFVDDWTYAWSVEQLLKTGELRISDWSAHYPLAQILRNSPLDDYRFAQSLTDRPVKVTLIRPDRIQQCYDNDASRGVSEHG